MSKHGRPDDRFVSDVIAGPLQGAYTYRGVHRNCTCTDISEAEVRILVDVLGCPAHGDGSDEVTQ